MASTLLKLLKNFIIRRFINSFEILIKFPWKRDQNTAKSRQIIPARSTFLSSIPPNSWDSHMHVLDPVKYPLAADAQYVPRQHLLSNALRFESAVGISNIVLVQPSIYGNDNSCMLDVLRQLGPQRARGVVAFDPDTTSTTTLREWHQVGVRGVRVNLQSIGKPMESKKLAAILHQYAEMIRPFDWVLQLYVPISTTVALEEVIPKLRVKVCLDHFGHLALPDPEGKSLYSVTRNPYVLPGFTSLINLLRQGRTFVKLSAPYRISKEVEELDIEPIAKELLRVVGRTRVVFATDWPHTRFEGLDIRPFMNRVVDWCLDDQELVDRVFRYNAEALWGVLKDETITSPSF